MPHPTFHGLRHTFATISLKAEVLERADEGDRAAITLRDESLAISGELGMRQLMERVLSRPGTMKA